MEFLYDEENDEKSVQILFSNDYISQECNKLGDIWDMSDLDIPIAWPKLPALYGDNSIPFNNILKGQVESYKDLENQGEDYFLAFVRYTIDINDVEENEIHNRAALIKHKSIEMILRKKNRTDIFKMVIFLVSAMLIFSIILFLFID